VSPEASQPPTRRDPTRRALVIAAVAVVAVIAAFFLLRPADETPAPALDVVEPQAPPPVEVAEPVAVDLYFPGEAGRLQVEVREIERVKNLEGQVTAIVEALLAGPSETGLMTGLVAPLPEGVTLSRVYVLEGGSPTANVDRAAEHSLTMLVDFAAPAGPPPSGSLGEMLTVYSIVNSVILNVAEVKDVVLTWNGVQPSTFAGHLDTSRPLRRNTGLIAGPVHRASGTAPAD